MELLKATVHVRHSGKLTKVGNRREEDKKKRQDYTYILYV